MKMKNKILNKSKTDRFLICTLLLCTALCCMSCSADNDASADADTAENIGADDSQTTGSDASSDNKAEENSGVSADAAVQDNVTDSSTSTNDTPVSSRKSNIKIEMHEEENSKTTDDGTVYFYKSCAYPVISMEGNVEAAEKINADIRSRIDSFSTNTQTESMADELIDFTTENDSGYAPLAYSENLTFKTIRADNSVISFTLTYEFYTGGAHGNYTTSGINYNARTGELLTFADLSDDPAAFREDTLAYNQKLAETDAYSVRMFSSEDITNGALESVLYADDAWYLSASGLVFISDPYALGPYAAGTIEFIIPYSDLADMGFNELYTYSDRFVLKLQCGERYPDHDDSSAPNTSYTYSHDLNGDGTEDAISLYREYVTDEEGIYETQSHLVINDIDYVNESDVKIREQLTEFFTTWAEPALYDLDVDDDYVELMFVSGETEGDDYIYYSHFYRYTKERALEYLGKVNGDANDPTVDTSGLIVNN